MNAKKNLANYYTAVMFLFCCFWQEIRRNEATSRWRKQLMRHSIHTHTHTHSQHTHKNQTDRSYTYTKSVFRLGQRYAQNLYSVYWDPVSQ